MQAIFRASWTILCKAYLHQRPADLHHPSKCLPTVCPRPRALPARQVAIGHAAEGNESEVAPAVHILHLLCCRSCAASAAAATAPLSRAAALGCTEAVPVAPQVGPLLDRGAVVLINATRSAS